MFTFRGKTFGQISSQESWIYPYTLKSLRGDIIPDSAMNLEFLRLPFSV